MVTVEHMGCRFRVTDDGYLAEGSWGKPWVMLCAGLQGVENPPREAWLLMQTLQEYRHKKGVLPTPEILMETAQVRTPFHQLFPGGLEQCCQWAGLPSPVNMPA